MKIVKPEIKFRWATPGALESIEEAGRTCYKSEALITKDSAGKFINMLLSRGHEAMIEHASMSYRVICDRGVTHEIVRHRLFSYAQESTRYCNYRKKGEIAVLKPPRLGPGEEDWIKSVIVAEQSYMQMICWGVAPEIARSVLPNCLKTEIVITGNFREWRHFFRLRTSKEAHPQMKEIADMILDDAMARVPIIFNDLRSAQ